jgi:hypothetical protein
MHPDNIKHSYSSYLANWLDLDLINLALSGGSNEDIFHSLIGEIDKTNSKDIDSVIAAWTSVNRLHWINKGRHWFFIPGWASSMDDLIKWKFHQHPTAAAFITGDSDHILETLNNQHHFFIENYLDDHDYLNKKLYNFKSALFEYCNHKKIKFISIDIFSEWTKPSHPTREEHLDLAKKFYKKFYKMDLQ